MAPWLYLEAKVLAHHQLRQNSHYLFILKVKYELAKNENCTYTSKVLRLEEWEWHKQHQQKRRK